MNATTQSTLTRLLAKENIQIQHGNFTTAFFDVKNRVLGLPIWKDKGKDVYDLLCGHEVGHALFTPADGLDEATARGISLDLLNVVEDARIEQMIQAEYPGLIACFRRGYQVLHKENFFGIGGDVNHLGFADRLNVKFKLGNLIDIRFTAEEEAIRSQIASAVSFEDALNATAALQKFLRDSAKKPKQQHPQPAKQDIDPANQEIDPTPRATQEEPQKSEDSQKQESNVSDDSEESQKTDESQQQNSSSEDKQDESSESSESDESESSDENDSDSASDTEDGAEAGASDADAAEDFSEEVSTQKSFDSNSKRMLDTSRQTLSTIWAVAPSAKECLENVLAYKDLAALRNKNHGFTSWANSAAMQFDFQKFMQSTKKIVSVFAKEFELRKAAHQYSRASQSKTGSLNLNKLHAYKVSDDIFLSVTKLANAKNHGMVMFVDYSGSMTKVMPHVLKHLINLALFCKAVGIPFQVYGFTYDNNTGGNRKSVDVHAPATHFSVEKILVSNTVLLDLVNSDLSKADFNAAIYALWLRSINCDVCASIEVLGGTPLNETLIIAHEIVKQFRAKHNTDKTNVILLTDGEGSRVRVSCSAAMFDYKTGFKDSNCGSRIAVKLNGRNINTEHHSLTEKLIENLRITTGVAVMGFYIPKSNADMRNNAQTAFMGKSKSGTPAASYTAAIDKTNKLFETYKAEDIVCIPGAFNYDNYFIVASGDDLSIDDDNEIEITADMTRSRMARVFSKYSSAKKGNRVFVSKFVEAVA